MKTIIIVPCFNEAKRLNLEEWKQLASDSVTIVFANDGSTDDTEVMISREVERNQNIFLYSSPVNIGKGPIIRNAYLHALISKEINDFEVIGYFDADFSTPSEEIQSLIKHIKNHPHLDGVFGSRIRRLGADIVRYESRHIFGRLFSFVVQILFQLNAHDTQCGAKVFRFEAAKKAFATEFVSRWIFDVEIILRLSGFNIEEYSLKKWYHRPGSKFNVANSILSVLRDLWIIKHRYKSVNDQQEYL